MNPTIITSRDFAIQNYYAQRIKHYVPSQCKHESIYLKKDSIRCEAYKQFILFVADKFALLPCMFAEPKIFFITAPIVFVLSTAASGAVEVRYPSLISEKKNWKDYFEATAILHDSTAKCLFGVLLALVIVNNVTSLIWPRGMVWPNAIFLGLKIGFVMGKIIVQRDCLPARLRSNNPALVEPLLNEV